MTAQARYRRWSLVPVAALACCVGLAFHRVFDAREVLGVASTCAVLPTALVLVCSGAARPVGNRPDRDGNAAPLWPSLVVSIAAWTLGVSATLYRDRAAGHLLPTPDLLREMLSDTIDAPRSILTTLLPAPAHSDSLVLVAVCVWITAFAGAEIALRTHATVAPAAPALVALTVPVLLGIGGQGSNVPVVVAVIASVGVLLLVRSPASGPPVRTIGIGVPIVVATALAAALLGPRLQTATTRQPPDLRTMVAPPPPALLTGINPLDRVSAWLREPDTALFTIEGESAKVPITREGYWRLTVLDKYDGVNWQPVGGLRPTAGRVPEPTGSRPAASTGRSVYRVTLQELDGVWLPGADRPARVSAPGVDLAVDPYSGVLATSSGLRPGLRYEVDSRVPTFDPDRLQYLQVTENPQSTALPEGEPVEGERSIVDFFRERATTATQGSTFPYQQALRLADWLRANHTYDHAAVPGHSYRNLQFFLDTTKQGTSEQFAAAFAVMARALGLPSRVVVGFTHGADKGDGSVQVRSGDVMAWPEIEFAGVGWVPFSPTPGQTLNPRPSSQVPQEAAPEPAPSQGAAESSRREKDARIAAESREGAPYEGKARSGDESSSPLRWVIPVASAGALLTAYVAAAVAAPWIRRGRRRRGDPHDRVIGAWNEIGEHLILAGMPASGALTVSEVVAYGVARLPGSSVGRLPELAVLVNDLDYAGRSADAADADAAWRQCAAVAAAVRRVDGLPRLSTRMRQRLRPRTVAAVLGRFDGGRR